ncbi:MAG: DNA-directed RNA polymerase subunit H [Candidatus Aenigmarchaeota archaeon]|nr:DNA-directed RNA polymerase subunit H [Candidatus Aenigmarchaeota archaeon]
MNLEILKHQLVPKHEILSSKEKREVLKKFNIEKEKLPRISVSDSVVKVIGAKPGDLIRITRKSPTSGKAIYYRFVVEG